MGHAAITKADLMFGGMDIDINQQRIQLKIEYIGGMPAVKQYILKRLAHGMGAQFIPHHASVDVKVLHVGLTTVKGRQSHPRSPASLLSCSDRWFAKGCEKISRRLCCREKATSNRLRARRLTSVSI